MTASPTPGLRTDVDELSIRLGRISAAAVTLRGLSADVRPGIRQQALLALLDDLDRDLALTRHDVSELRRRALAAGADSTP
jgi:hypothetical protein